MSKKAEIKKIVLDLGNKEVELTVGQAKRLHIVLDDMFGEKTVYTSYPVWPIIIERQRPYWFHGEPYLYYEGHYDGTATQMSYTGETQTMNLSIK